MLRRAFLSTLLAFIVAPSIAAADQIRGNPPYPPKKPIRRPKPKKIIQESQEVIEQKLDIFAQEHIKRIIRSLRPNEAHMVIEQLPNGSYCAWYLSIDPATLKTEMHERMYKGKMWNVGHIIYIEHRVESIGATQHEAIHGIFKERKSWRKRELAVYKNRKWQF